ncbi:MAG TPA: hypothetical protein VNA89_15265, partial [Gemmatimonadaceae bacterium]|nr:hypothetical protein [Gemmatimonadaceae bacterium]
YYGRWLAGAYAAALTLALGALAAAYVSGATVAPSAWWGALVVAGLAPLAGLAYAHAFRR